MKAVALISSKILDQIQESQRDLSEHEYGMLSIKRFTEFQSASEEDKERLFQTLFPGETLSDQEKKGILNMYRKAVSEERRSLFEIYCSILDFPQKAGRGWDLSEGRRLPWVDLAYDKEERWFRLECVFEECFRKITGWEKPGSAISSTKSLFMARFPEMYTKSPVFTPEVSKFFCTTFYKWARSSIRSKLGGAKKAISEEEVIRFSNEYLEQSDSLAHRLSIPHPSSCPDLGSVSKYFLSSDKVVAMQIITNGKFVLSREEATKAFDIFLKEASKVRLSLPETAIYCLRPVRNMNVVAGRRSNLEDWIRDDLHKKRDLVSGGDYHRYLMTLEGSSQIDGLRDAPEMTLDFYRLLSWCHNSVVQSEIRDCLGIM